MRTTLEGARSSVGLPNQTGERLEQINVSNIMLSQSGAALPADYDRGNKIPIIPPELFGQIERLEVTGLSPSGIRNQNTFAVGPDGRLLPHVSNRALGHVPYELALIGKDGTRFTTTVDITPSKIGRSHQGYEPLGALVFQREAPPPPEQLTAGRFLLSQSGAVFPHRYGEPNPEPLIPNNDSFFEKMIVTSLSPSNVRASNTFDITDDGHVKPKANSRPLGHVPYEITLVGKDGAHYSAVVDISPSKIGTSHRGYETIEDLVFTRRPAGVDTRTEAPLNQADAGFVQNGGGAPRATFDNSPLGQRLKR